MGQNPYCSIFSLKFDGVTVTLSLIVLSRNFYKVTLILSHFMLKFVKIECHLDGQKKGQCLLNGGPPSTLSLSNFRAKTVGPI